jgi:hypothetical protein
MLRQYSNIAYEIFVFPAGNHQRVLEQIFGREENYVQLESTVGSTLLARFEECRPAFVLPVPFWVAAW